MLRVMSRVFSLLIILIFCIFAYSVITNIEHANIEINIFVSYIQPNIFSLIVINFFCYKLFHYMFMKC